MVDVQEQSIILPESSQNQTTLLSQQEVLDITSKDINNRHYSKWEVEDFVENRVTAAKVNGDNIISIDFDHEETSVHPITSDIIRSPNTRVVVAEYFYPEVAKYENLIRNEVTGGGTHKDRLAYSRMIADVCRDAGKPVAVADIANKPSYMAIREIFRMLPTIGAVGASMINKNPYLAVPGLLGLSWQSSVIFQRFAEKGIFDKNQINALDKFFLDFEQARRMFLAKGVEQLTHEYPPLNVEGKQNPQIVVSYPKAHGIRFIDSLVNPQPNLDKAKSMIYKLFGPGLDYSVRTWNWKDSLQLNPQSSLEDIARGDNVASNLQSSITNNGSWNLISNRKIEV